MWDEAVSPTTGSSHIPYPSEEAPTGFEPVIRVLQTHALSTWLRRRWRRTGHTLTPARTGAESRVRAWCRG